MFWEVKLKRFRFIEHGLCCDVFYRKDVTNGKCALFLYGFPATLGSNSLTEILVNSGYTVLHPHYYGTYDSSGDFTPLSAYRTVEVIGNIVDNGNVLDLKSNKQIQIPTTIDICVAYSFGAFVLKHTLKYMNKVRAILLFSPVMSNNINNKTCWVNIDGQEHLDYVIRTRPYTYRINDLSIWKDQYVNDNVDHVDKLSSSVVKVAWFYGRNDPAIEEELLINKYLMATKNCISETADIEFVCIENGGHEINTLLNEKARSIIQSLL